MNKNFFPSFFLGFSFENMAAIKKKSTWKINTFALSLHRCIRCLRVQLLLFLLLVNLKAELNFLYEKYNLNGNKFNRQFYCSAKGNNKNVLL